MPPPIKVKIAIAVRIQPTFDGHFFVSMHMKIEVTLQAPMYKRKAMITGMVTFWWEVKNWRQIVKMIRRIWIPNITPDIICSIFFLHHTAIELFSFGKFDGSVSLCDVVIKDSQVSLFSNSGWPLLNIFLTKILIFSHSGWPLLNIFLTRIFW